MRRDGTPAAWVAASASRMCSKESDIHELGSITSMKVIGRTSAEGITVCDLTGTGVQDTAIAILAVETVRALESGVVIEQ